MAMKCHQLPSEDTYPNHLQANILAFKSDPLEEVIRNLIGDLQDSLLHEQLAHTRATFLLSAGYEASTRPTQRTRGS